MKKYIYHFLFLLLILNSCERTEMGDIDLDFKLETEVTTKTSFIGKPVNFKIEVAKVDLQNDYPFTLDIRFAKGKVLFDNKEYQIEEQSKNLEVELKNNFLEISYVPSEIGTEEISVILKNELVTKEITLEVECNKYLYTIRVENLPEKAYVDKQFSFDLIVEEEESTNSDSIVAYAQVAKGKGKILYGDAQLNKADNTEKERILIGRNTISYLPQMDGENIMRFFILNKWGNETVKDVPINVIYPTWSIETESDTIQIPLKEDYSFNLTIKEDELIEESSYISSFRLISAIQDFTMQINAEKVVQGKEFSLKNSTNIVSVNAKQEGTGTLEFFVRDRYKQEKTKKLFFNVKLPIRPIEASLEKTSIQIYENEKAIFKLNVAEKNYKGTFNVLIEQIDGSGIFTTGKEMKVSEGTHKIGYIPNTIGTHTFKITITDNNNQKEFLNATVQTEKNPLITVNTTTGGTATGGGTVKYGSEAILTAKPDAGYIFAGWFENGTKLTNELILKITAVKDRVFEARFTKQKYTISVSPTDGGTATGGGQFDYGTQTTIKATPQTGNKFIGWFVDGKLVSSSPNYSFVVEENTKFEAKFEKEKLTLTVNATAGGTATGSGTFDYGTIAELTAKEEQGYKFAGWFENGVQVGTSIKYSHKVVKSTTIEARFTKQKYTLTVSAGTGGTATGSGVFDYGTQATIKATPQTGYKFSGWSINGKIVSVAPTYLIEVNSNMQVDAKFEREKLTLTVNATAGGTATGSGEYEYGSFANLVATPETGSKFIGWFEGNTKIGEAVKLSYKVLKTTDIEARFEIKKYTLSVSATAGGTATGSGTFEHGQQTTVTAVPQKGYRFVGWFKGSSSIGTALSQNVTITDNMNLEARFAKIQYTVTITPSTGGETTGSGSYDYDTQATITATPQKGYKFVGWFENGKLVSSNMTYSFQILDNKVFSAKFEEEIYTVYVTSEGTAHGSSIVPNGNKSFTHSTGLSLQASIPIKEAQEFLGWYDQTGRQLSTSMNFTLKDASGVTRVIGKFKTKTYTVSFGGDSKEYISNQKQYQNPLPYGTKCSFTSSKHRNWEAINQCTGQVTLTKRRSENFGEVILTCNYQINHYKP